MFTVLIGKTEYVVRWSHLIREHGAPIPGTLLQIATRNPGEKSDKEKVISMVRTKLHPNDRWSRKVGTRKALTRALSIFDRDIRVAFWNAYSNTQVDPWGE